MYVYFVFEWIMAILLPLWFAWFLTYAAMFMLITQGNISFLYFHINHLTVFFRSSLMRIVLIDAWLSAFSACQSSFTGQSQSKPKSQWIRPQVAFCQCRAASARRRSSRFTFRRRNRTRSKSRLGWVWNTCCKCSINWIVRPTESKFWSLDQSEIEEIKKGTFENLSAEQHFHWKPIQIQTYRNTSTKLFDVAFITKIILDKNSITLRIRY